jgi:ribonuclease HII
MTNYTFGADGVAKGNYAGINIWCICGIPEGVVLPVKDSKKTNKKQRAEIVNQIKDKCIWSLGSSPPYEIDEVGISAAESLSLYRAYTKLNYATPYKIVLHTDLGAPTFNNRQVKLKNADDSIPAVSAASIFAKYALDLYWEQVHEHYSEYDFINNAGYGVRAKEAIWKYGLIEGIHRKSYRPCREYLESCLNKV